MPFLQHFLKMIEGNFNQLQLFFSPEKTDGIHLKKRNLKNDFNTIELKLLTKG